jgi:hypothetical protein
MRMQGSHLTATEMASAINSFVLVSSASGPEAALAMAENSFITSGAPARNTFTSADSSVIISSQFLPIITLSLPRVLRLVVWLALRRRSALI